MAIGDLKERLKAKFGRRHSTASSISQQSSADEAPSTTIASPSPRRIGSTIARSLRSRGSHKVGSLLEKSAIDEEEVVVVGRGAGSEAGSKLTLNQGGSDLHETFSARPSSKALLEQRNSTTDALLLDDQKHDSSSTADFPTPKSDIAPPLREEGGEENVRLEGTANKEGGIQFSTDSFSNTTTRAKKPELSRRQSLLPPGQTRLIKTLLETDLAPQSSASRGGPILDYFSNNGPTTISANMVSRKIWVKRPGASATLVTIQEDDLVDDVRDMILRKYANSLGRTFDSPDVTLRIVPREQRESRILGPEEPMARTLDAYFPGGQTVDEALLIDVPVKRTPKPSPQPQRGYYDENRPAEAGSDYFPPMPMPAAPSPHLPNIMPGVNGDLSRSIPPHSMSVLTTGHVPALPSPGSSATRRHHRDRPRIGRQHTSSPTAINGIAQQPTLNNEQSNPPPTAPPLPTPPAQHNEIIQASQIQRVSTPPPRISSPRPPPNRTKKSKKSNLDHPSLPSGSLLKNTVPPINVLIVEDNIINLKLLEAFMKRLKVRWQTAIDGREAVNKWRAGGFHLVLMDIQLPIMSGLEATKEIRRLERLNSIGVFSSSASSSAPNGKDGEAGGEEPEEKDRLPSTVLFKSPVIIVALTASSLQSDRHEALAAGCNDFLTKPVNFVWLERKVMEWGCMQALIDFDGWRKWKDFSQQAGNDAAETKKTKKKNRMSLGSNSGAAGGSSRGAAIREESVGGKGVLAVV